VERNVPCLWNQVTWLGNLNHERRVANER